MKTLLSQHLHWYEAMHGEQVPVESEKGAFSDIVAFRKLQYYPELPHRPFAYS